MHCGILQRTEDLDTAIEVARHHVGRGDIHSRFRTRQALAHSEAIDSAVFEEAADDRFDADIFRKPRYARSQAANEVETLVPTFGPGRDAGTAHDSGC